MEHNKTYYPSLTEVAFRIAALVMILFPSWAFFYSHHLRTAEEKLEFALKGNSDLTEALHGTQSGSSFFIGMGIFFLLALLGYAFFEYRKCTTKPLTISASGISTRGTEKEIPFSEIRSMVFSSKEIPDNIVLIEGVCSPEENAPNSSLDRVLLLSDSVDTNSFDPAEMDKHLILGKIEKLFLYRNNEQIAREIVSATLEANSDCDIYTAADKFKKQRLFVRTIRED